jgi:hypothetical protein
MGDKSAEMSGVSSVDKLCESMQKLLLSLLNNLSKNLKQQPF